MSEVNTDIFLNLVIDGTPPLYTYIPLDKLMETPVAKICGNTNVTWEITNAMPTNWSVVNPFMFAV
jgi:hypothetical protein